MTIIQAGGPRFEDLRPSRDYAFKGVTPPTRRVPEAEKFFSRALAAALALQRQGIAINPETLNSEDRDLPVRRLAELVDTRRWEVALEERGIADAVTPVTPQQMAALAVYMDMSVERTHAQKLRAAGVTQAKWGGWLRQPAFAQHLVDLSNEALQASVPVARQRIAEGVDRGEKGFIDLALKMTGNDPDRQFDVKAVLMQIFAVLDEEVRDPAVLAKVGRRVQALLGAGAGDDVQRGMVMLTASEPSTYVPTEERPRAAFPIPEA